jgi:poly-gamma-glutamate synthesis protein (capsule biosynthesis protein)
MGVYGEAIPGMNATNPDRLRFSEAVAGDTWSLYVAGDCVHSGSTASDPIGPGVRSRTDAADVSVVNLEAPIPADDSIPKAGPRKASNEGVPAMLADAGFDAVTLANNHAMDYGPAGLFGTIDACGEVGLDTVGAGSDPEDARSPLRYTVDGTDVAIANLCEREFGVATDGRPGTAWIGHPDAMRTVERAVEDADSVVLVAHGGVEFVPLPPVQWQRRLRRFVDAGVDLVVAHHPHVPQGWELHDGTPVFYSLGNFLFDHGARPKTRWGLSLEVRFDDGTPVVADLVLTEGSDSGVDVMPEGPRHTERLDYLHRLAGLTSDPDAMEALWQELATRLFRQRYGDWLRRAGGGDPYAFVTNPRQHLRRDALWDAEERREELLILLNLVRNGSHRSVMETALAVETGTVPDRRSPEVEAQVRELLSWTEDRVVYDRPSRGRRKLRSVLNGLLPDRLSRSDATDG